MKTRTSLLCTLTLLASLAWPLAAPAQTAAPAPAAAASPAAPAPAGQGTQYSAEGADTCIGCHDEDSDTATFKVNGIFKSRHAHRADARTPFGRGGLQCEACHGPGARHSASRSNKKATINSFKPDSFLPVKERNQACLACHEGTTRMAWHAGAHERGDVACTDCHKLHTGQDPVQAKTTQPDVCFACHGKERADFHKASAHPVRFGRMACSDCHNAHGSTTTAMLGKPTVNQTCYACHADKRGPMLWEHAPVAEDCTLCHSTHGSVRPALLNKTPPLLCQQCHEPSGHPSVARTPAGLPANGGTGAVFLVAGSCTNCHSQVHGSNHPAGSKLMR